MGITVGIKSEDQANYLYKRKNVTIEHWKDDLRGEALAYSVLTNMRPIDRHEFEAVGCDPWVHGQALLTSPNSISYVALYNDQPAFIFGTLAPFPHMRMIFGFGTRKAKRVIPAVTWFGQTYLAPVLRSKGVTRCEVRIPAKCEQSRKWLTAAFGAEVECELPGYSITGETMLQLAGVP